MLKLTQEMVPLKLSSSKAIQRQRRVPGKVYEFRHPGWEILPDEPSRDLNLRIRPGPFALVTARYVLAVTPALHIKDQSSLGPIQSW